MTNRLISRAEMYADIEAMARKAVDDAGVGKTKPEKELMVQMLVRTATKWLRIPQTDAGK